MVTESWFRSLWKTPPKHESNHEKAVIGILAFEVASLMNKLVHMWQSLTDRQVAKLREEVDNSPGITKLVSDDSGSVVGLMCAEMIENLEHLAQSVSRLASKCSEPSLKAFKPIFEELILFGVDPHGWKFTFRKMESKVKKMGRFVSVNASLYQEMEKLTELEQTLRRIKGCDGQSDTLIEFEKKLTWKKHEVRNLQEASLWKKTYDYTVLLLARSMFTIFYRIKFVFGIQQMVDGHINGSRLIDSDFIHRSQSVSAVMESPVNSENGLTRFSSGPADMFIAKSGPMLKTNTPNNFYSGPLHGSTTKSGLFSGKKKKGNFFSGPLERSTTNSGPLERSATKSGPLERSTAASGPLERSTTKSGPISTAQKTGKKIWRNFGQLTSFYGKKQHSKSNRLTQVGPFKGRVMAGTVTNFQFGANVTNSGIINGSKDGDAGQLVQSNVTKPSFVGQKRGLLDAPPGTLGAAALAMHYANVIIVIEKLAASPHLIGHDARDDLYNLLPASIRTSLRARLKPYSESLATSVYDADLAGEWSEAMTGILEWLAPLAHNMIRWQSERSFEQQNLGSKTNVLLVQTLFFADQEKTEGAISELLVGLNYIWRSGWDLNTKASWQCANNNGMFDEYLDTDG